MLSSLLYSSESWTTYARQDNHLKMFHIRNLRQLLGITWQDRVNSTGVLVKAGSLSMHLMFCQRRLRWLGHVHRMENGRIPKDIMNGELDARRRPTGHPCILAVQRRLQA